MAMAPCPLPFRLGPAPAGWGLCAPGRGGGAAPGNAVVSCRAQASPQLPPPPPPTGPPGTAPHQPSNASPTPATPSATQLSRRLLLSCSTASLGAVLAAPLLSGIALGDSPAWAEAGPTQYTDMPALRGKDYGKTKMKYPDYTETPSGLQFKDLRDGSGPTPRPGDTVVIDWDGFTIGYYGRIFEARNKAKGGSFEGSEKDFFRFRVGADDVIPAFEEAITSMQVGAIRRIIVPPELGYPNNDFNQKGPKPITFSGQRALDFVLRNQGLIDKTLLFDIELLRIVPS